MQERRRREGQDRGGLAPSPVKAVPTAFPVMRSPLAEPPPGCHVTSVPARDPVVTVFFYSAVASLTAMVGVLPQLVGGRPREAIIGWANAVAAGLMFGVAYMLLTAGLKTDLAPGALGALVGIGFVRVTHALTGTAELDRVQEDSVEHGYKVILADTLHAAHEGIAIGVAMLVSIPLGISMALALAVHNIPEAMVLNSVLTRQRLSAGQSLGLALATNGNQVLMAVVTFSMISAIPALLPLATGFAVGALFQLVLVELLPESYRQAGSTSIALVAMVALGLVVLLGGRTP